MVPLYAYVGRANRQRLSLLQDGVAVVENAISRAQFRFGTWCLDTDEADPIALTNNATVVEMQLGLVTGLATGLYTGKLTVYDNAHPSGIAWQQVSVIVRPWEACPIA